MDITPATPIEHGPAIKYKGATDMQVCVLDSWTDEQVLRFAVMTNSPTMGTWFIRRAGSYLLGGMPERNPCLTRVGYVHIMLDLLNDDDKREC